MRCYEARQNVRGFDIFGATSKLISEELCYLVRDLVVAFIGGGAFLASFFSLLGFLSRLSRRVFSLVRALDETGCFSSVVALRDIWGVGSPSLV
jgi:hypothetical protein